MQALGCPTPAQHERRTGKLLGYKGLRWKAKHFSPERRPAHRAGEKRKFSRIKLLAQDCTVSSESMDILVLALSASIGVNLRPISRTMLKSLCLPPDRCVKRGKQDGFSPRPQSATTSRRCPRRRAPPAAGRRRKRQNPRDHPSHGPPGTRAPGPG